MVCGGGREGGSHPAVWHELPMVCGEGERKEGGGEEEEEKEGLILLAPPYVTYEQFTFTETEGFV